MKISVRRRHAQTIKNGACFFGKSYLEISNCQNWFKVLTRTIIVLILKKLVLKSCCLKSSCARSPNHNLGSTVSATVSPTVLKSPISLFHSSNATFRSCHYILDVVQCVVQLWTESCVRLQVNFTQLIVHISASSAHLYGTVQRGHSYYAHTNSFTKKG